MISVTNICPGCGRELSQTSRLWLSLAGAAALAASVPLLFFQYAWMAAIVTAAIGLFLLFWGILAKGRWCSRCKKFPVSKSLVS
jgi:Flp pilus assembly protein TadB